VISAVSSVDGGFGKAVTTVGKQSMTDNAVKQRKKRAKKAAHRAKKRAREQVCCVIVFLDLMLVWVLGLLEDDKYNTADEKEAAQNAWDDGEPDPTNHQIPGLPGSAFYFDSAGRKRKKKACDHRAPVFGDDTLSYLMF
jgi:hypothetical protein